MNVLPPTLTRRVLGVAALVTTVFSRELLAQTRPIPSLQTKPAATPGNALVQLTVNDRTHDLTLDPRTTLRTPMFWAPRASASSAFAVPAPPSPTPSTTPAARVGEYPITLDKVLPALLRRAG